MKVRFTLALLAGLAVVCVGYGVQAAEEGEAESITVQGEVLDLSCYIAHEAKGESHLKCAQGCLKSGQPMGLLAKDGTVYLLYASHKDAAPYEETKAHAGKMVEIEGKSAARAGMKGVEVNSVKAL